MFDLIIIGGASAGLSAAIYAARKKLDILLLTKKIGGQSLLTSNIENYPGFEKISGQELVQKMYSHAKKYGAPLKEDEAVKIAKITAGPASPESGFEVKTKKGKTFEGKTVLIASGKDPRRLNVPGEKEYENKGVSFCSICDAPLFQDKIVAVIGGGNSGLEAARDLSAYAQKIYVLEFSEKIRGDELTQEKLKQTNKVEFITQAKTLKILGREFVNGLIYQDLKTNKEMTLKVEGVFTAIGWTPQTDFVKNLVKLNELNEIIIDPKTNMTSIEGIFAAGDASDILYKQCIIAAGEGAKAALSVYNYLSQKS